MQIFMTMCRWLLVSVTVVVLTACGGGTSNKSDTKQQIAIEKIMKYADDGSNTVPTLQDYQDAEVSGVTTENLDELNDLVDALVAEDVDTAEELNALTTELGINIAPISNAGADTTVQVNQAVAISGSGSDSDGTITSYQWRENGNVLANTASFSYTPATTGEHTLTLTVTDDDEATASDTITVIAIFNGTPATPLTYAEYKLSPLSDGDFNILDETQKYQVALKLYATLFYGADYDTLISNIASNAFISQTRDMFDQANDVSDIAAVEEQLLNYKGWGDGEIMVPMLARLFHLTPGKEYLNRWAAYVLTQTILFSPAYELDTVYTSDAVNVYNRLVRDLDDSLSLQWVTYTHMMTNENWRRFRSPEDNGREMLEIFLMDFNDAHVPLAAKALQNWKLDKGSNTLMITLNENTEPITDLFPGTTIVNGTDFYSALVLQPDFLSTISRRLVDIYFPNHTEIEKNTIVSQLVASKPTTWTGVLKQIIYSKEYLLDSEKTRSFEEAFFPITKILDWHPHQYSFMNIYKYLNEMHQSTMRYKLGRKTEVPLDSQSFAWYHKTIRENVMINNENNATFESWDDGWGLKEIYQTVPEEADTKEEIAEHIVHTLFISIIGRDASSAELKFFQDIIDREKYDKNIFKNFSWIDMINNEDREDDLKERGYFAHIILDYLSRLSITYSFDDIGGE